MFRCVLFAVALLSSAGVARAATGGIPVTLSHSGHLLDGGDAPVTGSVSLTFRVFDAPTGGTKEWEGTCAAVPVRGGYYTVVLGSANCPGSAGAGDSVLDTNDLASAWLEVVVGTTTLTPRLAIGEVPAAATALNAQALEGHPASDFALAATLDARVPTATLQAGKWCTSDGTRVQCTSDAPTGGTGGTGGQATGGVASPAACTNATAGYFWYDASSGAVKVCNGAEYLAVGTVSLPPGPPVATPATFNGGVRLTWSAVSGATGYEVGWIQGPAFDAATATIGAAVSPWQVTGLTNNQVYTFALRTLRAGWTSAWSTPVQATPVPLWDCSTVPTHVGCSSAAGYASCKAIKDDPTFTGTSGLYWLDPDGAGLGVAPFEARCDMTTDNGGWTLVAKVNGADADTVLYNAWAGSSTVGNTADLATSGGGDVLHNAYFHTLANELMFADSSTCGTQTRLLQTSSILGSKTLRQYLVDLPTAPSTGTHTQANFTAPAYRNTGCTHPFNPSNNATYFTSQKFGINITDTAGPASIRFTINMLSYDNGIASTGTNRNDGYNTGDLDARSDGVDYWTGHVATVWVR